MDATAFHQRATQPLPPREMVLVWQQLRELSGANRLVLSCVSGAWRFIALSKP